MERWQFDEGDEIAPGLTAIRSLGGGRRYEAHLAWQDHRRALVVAKVVRPDLVDDPATLEGLRGEARALERLSHPLLLVHAPIEPRVGDAQPRIATPRRQ